MKPEIITQDIITDRKTLLSNEQQDLHNELIEFKMYYSNKNLKNNFKLGVFSKVLASFPIFLYDNNKFVQDFPNGFVTENIIFINSKYFENIRKEDPKNKNEQIGHLFVHSLLKILEIHYNISFGNDEKLQINTNLGLRNPINNIKDFDYITNIELAQRFNTENIMTLEILTNLINRNTKEELSTIFEKTFENSSFLFSELKDKIGKKEIKNEKLDPYISLEEFKRIYEPHSFDMTSKIKGRDIIELLTTEAINKSNNVNDFIQLIDEKIIPFSRELNDNDFSLVMSSLIFQVRDKFKVDSIIGGFSDKDIILLAKSFAEKGLRDSQRSILIEEFTNYNKTFNLPSQVACSVYKKR